MAATKNCDHSTMRDTMTIVSLPAQSPPWRRPKVSVWIDPYFPILVALTLRFVSGSTASFSFLVLAIFALFGRSQAILALSLSWLFTMINPEIVADSDGASAGRYLVILAASATALARSRFFSRKVQATGGFAIATVFLGACIVLHSVLFSVLPEVSVLKAVSWVLTMTSLVALWHGLSPEEFDTTVNRVYHGLVLVLIFSLPFLVLPAGFAVNGTGFQGILNHPQAFGGTIALLGAWSGARMLGQRVPSWKSIALAGICFVLVLLSEARTAGVSMVAGLALSLVLAPAFAGRGLIQLAPGVGSPRVWSLVAAACLAAVAMAATFSSAVINFLSKSGRASSGNLLEAYDTSRGFLIDAMLVNISDSPLLGIGFGVASVPSTMEIQRDPLFGLPISASVEKGAAPVAIVEELGAVLAALVGLWVFALLRKGAVGGLAAFAVCITALMFNMGENTLFSPGGQGMLVLVLLGWVSASGKRMNRHV